VSDSGPSQLRFDDGKDAQALRTIGEVAAALGIRQHVLRYWEQQFPMLRPLKRSGGRRYYRPEDVALVQAIDRLVNREGYTLKGARQAIEGGAGQGASPAPVQAERPSTTAASTDILPQLRAIRDRLAKALEAA
jgi:DNA-binding transcriptional MerR regulator